MVGRTITLNGVRVAIVGVAPPKFFGVIQTLAPDLTVPITLQPRVFPSTSTELWAHGDEGSFLTYDITDTYGPPIVARLKPDVGIARAQAELTVLYRQVLAARGSTKTEEQQRRESADQKIELTPTGNGSGMFEPQERALLFIIMSAVPAVVLLIACANVGTLLLARAAARSRRPLVRGIGAPASDPAAAHRESRARSRRRRDWPRAGRLGTPRAADLDFVARRPLLFTSGGDGPAR